MEFDHRNLAVSGVRTHSQVVKLYVYQVMEEPAHPVIIKYQIPPATSKNTH